MAFWGKLFKAVKNMVFTGKPEEKSQKPPMPKPTTTATAGAGAGVGAGQRRSRIEDENEVPREVRFREFNHWDNFEDYYDDVETLGESEYDETV